ncbi:hypothetical protein [Halobacteriovorax sp. HLS]|uniref:hypothetical protein n=1 Tax=Halobacteriovorax sp. HLS TaxID=2234000 RepID=UPI000FD9FF50|nr:hypothetical protein [Halobacteriovorax sp. HLS]
MTKTLIMLILSINIYAHDNFFANKYIQVQNKQAFALQAESKDFVKESARKVFLEADYFLELLRKNQPLLTQVLNYKQLPLEEQIVVLKKVFDVEVQALGITAPEVSIDTQYPRAAYFKYNLEDGTNGEVFINPKKTYDSNPLMSLSLLIHETRHAAQLYKAKFDNNQNLYQAFKAQAQLSGKLSFSDFLTLNNEYEAFLFANYIIFKLYGPAEDMIDMGTFASQFNEDGSIKIDLTTLHQSKEGQVLEEFNILMQKQRDLLQ